MKSSISNSRPQWAVERPTGIWIITLWLTLFGAVLPLFVMATSFIRHKRVADAVFNAQDETLTSAGALVVLATCLGAWLGLKWFRYPLALLAALHGSRSIFHNLAMASEGKVALGDASSLWLKIPFVLICTILAVCYLHADSDVRRFFTPYKRHSVS